MKLFALSLLWIACVGFFLFLLHGMNMTIPQVLAVGAGMLVLWVLAQWRLGKFDRKQSDTSPKSKSE